jgi:hypothetical protein
MNEVGLTHNLESFHKLLLLKTFSTHLSFTANHRCKGQAQFLLQIQVYFSIFIKHCDSSNKKKLKKKKGTLEKMGSKLPHCILLNDWIHQGPYLESQVGNIVRARLAVSVLHDIHRGLMPPIQHHYCKDMPDLVA